jgi:Family of unknown function (DUF5999)
MCAHSPQCPAADSAARTLAVVIADHHEQGWTLLCNGVVHFDDGVDLLPGGAIAGNGVISGDAAFGNCCSSSGAVRARRLLIRDNFEAVQRLRKRVEIHFVEDPVPEQGERAAHRLSARAREIVGRPGVDGDVKWLFELT